MFKRKKRFYYKPKSSLSETLFLDLLEQTYNIKINRQFCLKKFLYDGQINNILIEIDSDYWHHRTITQAQRDFRKDKGALKNGYNLIRINVNNKEEIYKVIEDNKQLLEETFRKK